MDKRPMEWRINEKIEKSGNVGLYDPNRYILDVLIWMFSDNDHMSQMPAMTPHRNKESLK